MLYNDIDLTIDTVAPKDILISTRADEQPYHFSSGTAVLSELQRNISYLEKRKLFKTARQMQDICRTEIALPYDFKDVNVSNTTATATVLEIIKFYYTGELQQSLLQTMYTVDLVKLSGRWLVGYVTDNDWFDDEHKNDPNFTAQNAVAYAYTNPTADRAVSNNKDFVDFVADGGDCMNFASQSMWAGFNGNQTHVSIDAHLQPMDSDAALTCGIPGARK